MMRFGIVIGLLFAAACGDAHMSDGYGRRVRGALDAQIAREGGGLPLYGEDARAVLMRFRGISQQSTQYSSSGLGGQAASGMGSGPGMSASPSTTTAGPPRLDAIR